MMLISDNMKVGLVTTHIPVSNIKSKLTTELISKKIKILRDSLITDFEIDKPIIAVLGLNPHAGDDGLMGTEEKTIILPAIEKARAEGIILAKGSTTPLDSHTSGPPLITAPLSISQEKTWLTQPHSEKHYMQP